jgi:hypothetical protein
LHLQALRDLAARDRSDSADEPPEFEVFQSGDRVQHRRFGAGSVLRVWSRGRERKISVEFDDPAAGKKDLLIAYAGLTKLAAEAL